MGFTVEVCSTKTALNHAAPIGKVINIFQSMVRQLGRDEVRIQE
jgi:hypothetical protein